MKIPKIKICGLTTKEDAEILNEYNVDYAGFVLFYPKSKRNLKCQEALEIIKGLKKEVKKVAVVVEPTIEQIEQIQSMGFDYIQIHGMIAKKVINKIKLPVFLAINIREENFNKDKNILEQQYNKKVEGYLLDGKIPGSGETFDWKKFSSISLDNKMFILAGGLKKENVEEGIRLFSPDIVDVSSGVEKKTGKGKDKEKVKEFVQIVRKER